MARGQYPASPTFDLVIEEALGGYTAQVQAAFGVGELPPQPFVLPLDLAALPRQHHDVMQWVEQARIVQRGLVHEEVDQARELGTALFEQLFTGEVLACFRASRTALPPNEYLRLRLRLPAALVSLPWELLFDPRDDQFLALAPDLVLVRYPEMPTPVTPLHIDGPLQVVVVAASPHNIPPLGIERELLRITNALKGPIERGLLVLDVVRGPDTLGQLRMRLRQTAHVVHILCHGDVNTTNGEGVLLFEDVDGAAEEINAELLRLQIQKQRGQTQLVLLNACLGARPAGVDPFSSVGAALMRGGVPAVLAMQFAIPDDVAIDLARVFYAELAAGTPVDLAVNETRMQLYGRNPFRLDWVIPVLFLRATTGTLFEIAAAPQPSTPVAAAATPPAFALPAATAGSASVRSDHPPSQPVRARQRRLGLLFSLGAGLLLITAFVLFSSRIFRQNTPTAEDSPSSGGAIAETQPTPAPASGASPDAAALPAPVFPTATPTPQPLTALNVSNTPGRSDRQWIGFDAAGVLHLVWLDNTPRQGQGETVLHRQMSSDGTWSEVEDLTPGIDYVGDPFLLTNFDGKLCLVLNSVVGLYTRCLSDGNWTPLADPEPIGITNVFGPALDADGQLRRLVGLNEVKFAGTKLDDGLADVSDAQLAIDTAGRYHAVWRRAGNPYSIEYRFSDDGGKTWSEAQRLSAPDAEFAGDPTLAADGGGGLHLVWTETGKMLYRRWTPDDGWLDVEEFGGGAGSNGLVIGLAPDGDGLANVVWQRDCVMRYAYEQQNDAWNEPRVVANVERCGIGPRIAIAEDGTRHIVWVGTGADGEQDVFYATLP